MSEHERRKTDVASRSGDVHDEDTREHEQEEAASAASKPEQAAERRDQGVETRRPAEPGGGRHADSEKPDSPDSRWGGGR